MAARRMAWLTCLLLGAISARGDEFERIEGEALAGVPRSKDATPHEGLTLREIDALPTLLRDARSPLLIATTDQGNFTRILVTPAFRKSAGGEGKPVPVLVLERFDTFEGGNIGTRLARGKDLLLFDGFQVDLDSGQVVPEGQGGDLKFVVGEKENPRLIALGKAKLYTLSKAPAVAMTESPRPSSGRAVIPTDFTGRYRLFANGQWSGTLELKVDREGAVSGRFRSDLNGTSYPVEGRAAADVPQKITFTITYPRTRQDFDGLIWTDGKGALAGTLTMLDRAYGFFAIREGGRFAPEGEDVSALTKGHDQPGRRIVVVRKGQLTLDGTPKSPDELTDALKKAVATDPATWVVIQADDHETFAAVRQAIEAINASGVTWIRLAPVP
jgi:hypothetical protein